MNRDAQDLETIKRYDDSFWLRYLAENTVFDTDNIKAQKDWLIEQVEAERARADRAERREGELKDTVEKCLNIHWEVTLGDTESSMAICDELTNVLVSVYSKEG
ncbi:hypothetical protein ACK8P5_26280 (plasmid) [Paenibacillus sp. EC2-1]|uniref:hypothetical protein n=1 Tax=Paenibacillus sp. EC2-1 TaxID=3388665 RepID=UPI003BEF0256